MDLQELKQNWNLLNERLATSEIYHKRLLREVINGKNAAAYEHFHRSARRGILSTIAIILLMTVGWLRGAQLHTATYSIIAACCLLQIAMLFCRCYLLSFLDTASPVQVQLRHTTQYHKWYVGERVVGFPVGLLCLSVTLSIEWSPRFTALSLFFVLFFLFLSIARGWYEWKRHRTMISEIRRNLAELQEFE